MRVFLSPQFNENEYITYMFSEEKIKAERYVLDEIDDIESEHQESDKEYKLSETLYYDFSNIETELTYVGDDVVSNVKRDDSRMLHIEILNPINEDSPEELKFPEWFDVDFEDFTIPEDAEIIQLEELVISEPEGNNAIEKLEGDNRALTLRVEELKKQMETDQKANEEMTLELLELMMGLI